MYIHAHNILYAYICTYSITQRGVNHFCAQKFLAGLAGSVDFSDSFDVVFLHARNNRHLTHNDAFKPEIHGVISTYKHFLIKKKAFSV